MDTTPITIRFAPHKYSRIKELAEQKQVSIAQLVRQTMDQTLGEDTSKSQIDTFAEIKVFAKKMAKKHPRKASEKSLADLLIEMRYEQ